MKVLVCGSRELQTTAMLKRVEAVLEGLYVRYGEDLCLIVGSRSGIDEIAYQWAHRNGVPAALMDACWDFYGKPAGPIRNGWMLKFFQPDLVVAFPGGRGTANMVKQAREAGINVDIHE